MAYTQTDLDNVKAAFSSPEQSVEVGGRKVVFRNVDELRKMRDDIASELAATSTSGSSVRRGTFRPIFTTYRGD
jgi:hypothetical protein